MRIDKYNIEALLYYKKKLVIFLNTELKNAFINQEIPLETVEIGKEILLPGRVLHKAPITSKDEKNLEYTPIVIIKIIDRVITVKDNEGNESERFVFHVESGLLPEYSSRDFSLEDVNKLKHRKIKNDNSRTEKSIKK